jgi:hypothetical protein
VSRIRQIKPGFFKDADLYDAEVSSGLPLRLAFAGLWTVTDKRGVFVWSRNIKPDVLPYDPCDMLAVLDALEAAGFVRRYAVDGKTYGFIPGFANHQHFHKDEQPSKVPAPPSTDEHTAVAPCEPDAPTSASTVQNGLLIGERGTGNGEREAGNGKVRGPRSVAVRDDDPRFAKLWATYPRRAGGNSRAEAFAAWRARIASGVDPDAMQAGAERYARHIRAKGDEGTSFVKQAKAFLGPAQHWAESWDVPPPDSRRLSKQEVGRNALTEWLATQEQEPANG